MKKASIIIDKDYVIGEIDPRIYGAFVEHLDAVCMEVYEPEHAEADEEGFRKDVMEPVKGLDVPVIRYPEETCVRFNWEDYWTKEPGRQGLIWPGLPETNEFGLHGCVLV